MKRDGSKSEDASARLNSQMAIDKKATYADEIIDNSQTAVELEEKVTSFARKMDKEIGWTWMLSWVCPPIALAAGIHSLLRKRFQRRP